MKKLLYLFFLLFIYSAYSQKEANFWYFGNGASLDFNSGAPIPGSGSKLNTTEGCSSFSDSDGNLLFYVGAPNSNARSLTVWDKNNNEMPNGTGLRGDSSSAQSALTVPAPGRPGIYYLFTVGTSATGNSAGGIPGFFYYEIDINLNNGLGDINTTIGDSTGAINLSQGKDNRWTEKVTAVRANTCNTFWVISLSQQTSSNGNNEFYAYKISDAGVDTANPVISEIQGFRTNDVRGYLKVSPDGTTLVAANMEAGSFLFNFNDETGIVTNYNNSTSLNQLNLGANGYGVEFSTSSKRLYVSTGNFSNTTENLYQFDLTKLTFTEINNSRFLVHSYFNARAALQLGPDAKIYWSSDGSSRISVINNPEELGAAVNYSHKSVNLGSDVTATQGLPPFLSSLLLPIEITDSSSNEVINNQDLQFCIGDNKTIIPETVLGSNITYEWILNNGTTTNTVATTTNLTLTNLSKTDSGTYTLTIKLTDDCGNVTQYNGTFNVEVFDAAIALKPTNINFCDDDSSLPNNFDLAALKNTEILDGLNPTLFNVLYFDSLEKATLNTTGTDLPNPLQVNNQSSQTIYARVQNKNAPNGCFDITDFELEVTNKPQPIQPTVYRLCDDTTSTGGDTDGKSSFLLNIKDNEVLGTMSPTEYKVSYHTSFLDAQTSSSTNAIDKNINYEITNSQKLYIRVENNDRTSCFDASLELDLIVDPLPIIKNPNPAEIRQCVNTLDGKSTINLTTAENNISDNPNGRFEYYEDQAATQQILNFTSYPVDANTNPPKSVWVKTISEFECFRISELNLIIGTALDEAYDETFIECDDFLDFDGNDTATNSDTDGITWFNLDKTTIENNINSNVNIDIFFYETSKERDESKNAIDISNYRNKNLPNLTGSSFPIYYKLINKINSDCEGFGQIYLQVDSVPTANPVADLELCDDVNDGDGLNGIVQSFDLESQNAAILGTQNPANFTVTYHLSPLDANAGNSPQSSPFANITRDTQKIFVRVTNNTTNCFTDHISFNVIVNPLPIANFVQDLEICDDNSDGSARNGFSQSIDLESQNDGILGTQDPTINLVTYHRSLAEAQNGTNPLISPYSNATPNRETIFVRVYNSSTMCANGISNFDVIINPEPNFVPVSNLSYCDDMLDGDDTNGSIQNIDLESQIPNLLGASQDPDDFIVTFHNSQIDATSGNSPIASPYTNTNSTETVYVRILNKATSCINDDATFDVIINSLPDFTVTTPQILCLNDLPLNITVENPRDVYTYFWTDVNGTVLNTTSTDNINITTGGTYTVTATTTNGTMCSRVENIVIEESNPATLEESFITIIDESNNIGSEDNISIYINTIDNDLGPGDYQFAILNTDDNTRTPSIGFQDEPLFENLEGGIYKIIVNDKNGCSPDAELLISVIQFPKFFTPNGDGKNDTWVIKGANKTFYPNSSINIFNRFGKLVAQIPIDGQGWDGTYNGKTLASDDYWFNIQLIPANTSKQPINKKGHFSLLRR